MLGVSPKAEQEEMPKKLQTESKREKITYEDLLSKIWRLCMQGNLNFAAATHEVLKDNIDIPMNYEYFSVDLLTWFAHNIDFI